MNQQRTVHLVSWCLGLLDQLFRVLNFALGSSRPKFFSKGWGDLESCYLEQDALLEDLAKPNNGTQKKYRLENEDITWTMQSQDRKVKIQQGQFRSPLADFLPEESKMAHFLLVEPSSRDNDDSNEDNKVFVIMLPATGEMGKGTRLALARTLAAEYGWSSIILTAAYYGQRKPSGQTLFFLATVRDLLFQARSIFQEGAMLVSYFQNEYSKHTKTKPTKNKVCVTGFSFGAAMAANTCTLATRMGADGKRLGCAAYVGCASPIVLADGVLQTSIDWKALRSIKDEKREEEYLTKAQERLYNELNKTQLTLLTNGTGSGRADNAVAVIKGMAMKHDAFISPSYALELQKQLLPVTEPSNPPVWEWLWGGHVLAALMRPVYHKRLVVSTVRELQNV